MEVSRVEMYSSQAAKFQLCRVLGLEQQARENERDAKMRARVARSIDRLAEKFGISSDEAKDFYLRAAPEHSKYIN